MCWFIRDLATKMNSYLCSVGVVKAGKISLADLKGTKGNSLEAKIENFKAKGDINGHQ